MQCLIENEKTLQLLVVVFSWCNRGTAYVFQVKCEFTNTRTLARMPCISCKRLTNLFSNLLTNCQGPSNQLRNRATNSVEAESQELLGNSGDMFLQEVFKNWRLWNGISFILELLWSTDMHRKSCVVFARMSYFLESLPSNSLFNSKWLSKTMQLLLSSRHRSVFSLSSKDHSLFSI